MNGITDDARKALALYKFTAGDAGTFTKQSTWFQDADGRYILFRGVNIGSQTKLCPHYLPLKIKVDEISEDTVSIELQNVAPALDLLPNLGFNAVRLLIMWRGVSPNSDGKLNTNYLGAFKQIIQDLYRRGIFVFIDFHQDIASDRYSGDGFPDWAIGIDDEHPEPPVQQPPNDSTWGLRYYDLPMPPFYVYKKGIFQFNVSVNSLVRNTLKSFWQDSTKNSPSVFNTRSALAATIAGVADYFATNGGGAAILGFEPFNEPYGGGYEDGTMFSKTRFEPEVLLSFYQQVFAGMKNKGTFLFIEPRCDWTVYPATAPDFNGIGYITDPAQIVSYFQTPIPAPLGEANLVFSFHFYDLWTETYAQLGIPDSMENKQKEWPGIFTTLANAARSRGMIPFLTEFGGSNDWTMQSNLKPDLYKSQIQAYLDLGLQQVEANLLNATLWVFELYSTNDGKDNWNDENYSLIDPHRVPYHPETLARPYPMRSSAEPVVLSFDLETKYGIIVLNGAPCTAPTVIFIPNQINYPKGFEIHSTSNALKWDSQLQLLYWLPDPNQTSHQVIVCPIGTFDASKLPGPSKQILGATKYITSFGITGPG